MENHATIKKYCTVRLLDVPYHLDKPYDYYIPITLKTQVETGSFVTVPFGRGNRSMAAVVTAVSDRVENSEVKPVLSTANTDELMTREEADICSFLCEYTLCTYGEAVKTVVPASMLVTLNEYYTVTDKSDIPDDFEFGMMTVYNYIKTRGQVAVGTVKNKFGEGFQTHISDLVKGGYIAKVSRCSSASVQYIKYAELKKDAGDVESLVSEMRSKLQADIVRLLSKTGRITVDELFVRVGKNARPQLSSLEKKGIISLTLVESYRNPYLDKCRTTSSEESPLSSEQSRAYAELCAVYEREGPKAALLHGVTGSGKTRVIKEMIDKVTDDGKSVIMLVPEISLTPQTVGYFCSRYGDRVAVIHSGLSKGERFDAWRRIRRGEADIVIGTRSAIFAPVKNLGMIVIDEEQEHTYKSDTDPKYLAHDVARFRSGKNGSMMLLSSATPSFMSYHKAKSGIYTLVEMKERYGDACLPKVVISDMRGETEAGNVTPVGSTLARELLKTYKKGKQSIVFLNRRGYNSAVSCRVCGEAVCCPHCSVSLTYHTKKPIKDASDAEEYFSLRQESGVLLCHYCGYKTKLSRTCPSCNAEHFRFVGYGTQRAEEELSRVVPGASILRMDMDTTSTKNAHAEILEKFRRGEADILLGTQMVTKGHDFPAVTLVGVMNADSSLYLDDYRASEKTFSMLTQVIGRAGRGKDAGVAVVQTSNPESEVIRLAASQNYTAFFEKEIRLRRALVFPPFCDIATLTLSANDESMLTVSAKRVSERLRELLSDEYKDVEAVVFGPFEAPVYKVHNSCRMRFCIKCRLNKRSRALIRHMLCEFGKAVKNVTLTADLNPSSL